MGHHTGRLTEEFMKLLMWPTSTVFLLFYKDISGESGETERFVIFGGTKFVENIDRDDVGD